MKKIEDLIIVEGNEKVILFNKSNCHWARMPKEKYDLMMSDIAEKERMEVFLNKKFGLLEETESVTPQIRSIYYSVTGR